MRSRATPTCPSEQSSPPGSETESPEGRLGRIRLLEVLQRTFMTELTARQRQVILAELRDMPQEELCRHLGTNRNALYKLGHDARKSLRRGLEEAG
jgi:RNA polymerase sigma-70 factor, ECF subfamily